MLSFQWYALFSLNRLRMYAFFMQSSPWIALYLCDHICVMRDSHTIISVVYFISISILWNMLFSSEHLIGMRHFYAVITVVCVILEIRRQSRPGLNRVSWISNGSLTRFVVSNGLLTFLVVIK